VNLDVVHCNLFDIVFTCNTFYIVVQGMISALLVCAIRCTVD